MGAGATSGLSEEEQFDLYKKVKKTYESGAKASEDDKKLFELVKKEFESAVPKSGVRKASEPRLMKDAHHRGTYAKLTENTEHEKVMVGDVVKAKLPGEAVFYEGVVINCHADGTYQVDFGDSVEDHIPRANIQRKLPWSVLELGDQVQARPQGDRRYYAGEIVGMNADGTYIILFEGEEEPESNIPFDKIRKVASSRTQSLLKWKRAFNTVKAAKAFNTSLLALMKTGEA